MNVLIPPGSDRDHIQGSRGAPPILVEFGDYERLHCKAAYPADAALDAAGDVFLRLRQIAARGTPTFFTNGVRHEGGYDLASLLEGLKVAQ